MIRENLIVNDDMNSFSESASQALKAGNQMLLLNLLDIDYSALTGGHQMSSVAMEEKERGRGREREARKKRV